MRKYSINLLLLFLLLSLLFSLNNNNELLSLKFDRDLAEKTCHTADGNTSNGDMLTSQFSN